MITMGIKGANGGIVIGVSGYENESATNSSDANWLRAEINLKIGNFTGTYQAALTTEDFHYFKQELHEAMENLDGKAVFMTDEEAIGFEVEISRGGSVIITGTAKAVDYPRVNFGFEFKSDQTYLKNTMSDLDDLENHYPVLAKIR